MLALRQNFVLLAAACFASAGCCLGAEVTSATARRGPLHLRPDAAPVTLSRPYRVRDRATELCLELDPARYALDIGGAGGIRVRRPGERRDARERPGTPQSVESTWIDVEGFVVTTGGARVRLRGHGYVFVGRYQYLCLGLPRTLAGTEVAAIHLTSSAPLAARGVEWKVIVR
ncbi:MAG TPA: hypothetical protein VKA84_21765 [Gemmatimonadaceae bacterium]|nr:hypothetical protein [Gemmatimonadaceae bacterium]